MRVLILALTITLLAGACPAQDLDGLIEVLRSDIRTDKVAHITAVMQFNEPEADVFWPMYRDYQFELDKLADQYLAAIQQYAEHYESMDPDLARELVDKVISIKKDRLDLQKDYFKKFSKRLTAVRAARWLQLENQLGLMLELQVVSMIPFAILPTSD